MRRLILLGLLLACASTAHAQAVQSKDPKDSGRTRVTFTADAVTPAASETLITFVKDVAGTATTGQTTYSVTAGKTFRAQAIAANFTQSSTVVVKVRVRLRENTGGTCSATSTLVATFELGPLTTTAVANTATATEVMEIPDGLEFPAADSLCLSAIATSAAGTLTLTIAGFEY